MMRELVLCLLVAAASGPAPEALAAGPAPAGLIPFVLPWDDGSPGPTDLSFLNHVPAGKFGPVAARADGHFYAGEQRVRFFGVNLCFAGTIPDADHADKIAARMAKFGINVVRLHHMDTNPFPNGLTRGSPRSGELESEALDRLGNFLARLKAHGIYADVNLLVGRQFRSADGLPSEIDGLDFKLCHAIAMFDPAMIELQKQYARDLLSYRNPQTGLRLANDPAVAFVEINNENGLLQQWFAGNFDHLPEPFAKQLRGQWNEWLKARYKANAELRKAWAAGRQELAREMLSDLSASARPGHWVLEQHGEAAARARVETDVAGKPAALRIEVQKNGAESWHVQLGHPGLRIGKGQLYTLGFSARAEPPRRMDVVLTQAHQPWRSLGFQDTVELGSRWSDYRYVFLASSGASNARVSFTGLGRQAGSVWLTGASLRPGGEVGPGEGETLEQGSIPLLLCKDRRSWPAAAREDFVGFLRDTEGAYWRSMRQCVKGQLGFEGVVMGTISDCSPTTLQAEFDAVDGHAYWQHPHFPGRPWDPEDWIVGNISMVNEPGGRLAHLSLKRVAGKPFTVTEYNHPAPNTYGSEGPLLLAAQAALQDWDALFLFAYAHRQRFDSRRIDGFFDIGQHPTKMANLAAAALLFRAGHVSPAKELAARELSSEQELRLLAQAGRAWGMTDLSDLGVPPATAVLHQTALRLTDSESPGAAAKQEPPPGNPDLLISDTGQVTWDRRQAGKGVVTINSPRTKAAIGFPAGRSFDLGGLVVTPHRTLQDWCTVSLSLVEGDSFTPPYRALLVATGLAQNTGMHWKNPEHSSVGRQWGDAPSLVEVVPAAIRLATPPGRMRAWALDEHGQRSGPLKVQAGSDGGSVLEIGESPTLWYEVVGQ